MDRTAVSFAALREKINKREVEKYETRFLGNNGLKRVCVCCVLDKVVRWFTAPSHLSV